MAAVAGLVDSGAIVTAGGGHSSLILYILSVCGHLEPKNLQPQSMLVSLVNPTTFKQNWGLWPLNDYNWMKADWLGSVPCIVSLIYYTFCLTACVNLTFVVAELCFSN
jgi:hypothetical protein